MRPTPKYSECFGRFISLVAAFTAVTTISACTLSAKIFNGLSETPQPPTLLLSSTVNGPSNLATWNLLLTSSESLSQISASDFSVTNGTITSFTPVDTTHWNIVVTPTAEGPVSISLPANFAKGTTTALDNEASNTLSMISDVTAPQVTLGYLGTSPTNVSPLVIDVVFDENVVTPDISDFQVTNGSIDSITGSGGTYSIEITPSSNLTTVGVQYLASKTTDLAGNGNTAASNNISVNFNSNRPLPTLSTAAGTHTNVAAITVDVSFSAAVTGFDASDLDLTNATVSGFTGSGDTYSFTLTATTQGDFSARVKNNAATDASTNLSSQSNLLTVKYDSVVPTVTLSKTEASPTTLQAITITVTASESVTGLALSDFTTTNLTLSSLSGSGTTYTLTATANAEGACSIQLPAGTIADPATNANTVSNTVNWYYDTAAPSITVASTQSPSTNVSPIAITLTTNEAVTGFTSSDVAVTNGTLSNFANVDATHWTADVTPTADGNVVVTVAAASFQDGAGKDNTVGSLTVAYDGTRPTVALTGLSAYSTTSPKTVTATFSESVTGFALADLTLVNATATVSGSGTTYTITVTPTTEGAFSVTVNDGAAVDAVGNTSTASSTLSSIYDITPPTATITSDVGIASTFFPIPLTIRFSEPITDLTTSDFTTTGGASVTSVIGFGSVYYLLLNPGTQGAKSVTLSVGTVVDAAGLSNTATAASSVFYYDTTPTTIAITEREQTFLENDATAKQFTITSTTSKPYPINIKYSITGTAVSGTDYDIPSVGTIVLPANTTSLAVPFQIYSTASTANKYLQLNMIFADTPVGKFSANYQSRVMIRDVDGSHPSIIQMSSKKKMRCAIYTGGTLKCWGYNASGSLGVGNSTLNVILTPTQVTTADTYQQVAVSDWHVCAVTTGGDLQCWGNKSNYRIGDNINSGTETSPKTIGTGFSYVTASVNTSCGIKAGKVYCWGLDVTSNVGATWPTPTQLNVGSAYDFVQVSAGENSVCALDTNNDLYCFGANTYGQMANGAFDGTNRVTLPLGSATASGYTKIELNTTRAGGEVHACALNTLGKLYCWGHNSRGVVGDGSTTNRNTPTLVSGSESYLNFSVGAHNTCAITTSSRVQCWGSNSNQVFGVEIGGNLATGDSNLSTVAAVPTFISDTSSYSMVSSGEDSTCGVLTDGRVKCWGEVDYLTIGDGTEYPRLVPSNSDAGQKYKALALGGFGCGITDSDQLKCWGRNVNSSVAYSIGDDTTLFRPSPVMLDRGQTYSKVSVGANHACGITTDKTLKCWGLAASYQLGTASTTALTLPTVIDGAVQYKEVSAGTSHSCAITVDGDLKCWGWNASNQIGDGTSSTAISPKVITSGTKYIEVKTGMNNTCAIATNNDAYCWGTNTNYQVGDGTNTNRTAPTLVPGGYKFTTLSLNGMNTGATCGMLTSGRIYCWGSGATGFTGANNGGNTTTPTEISGGSQVYSALSGNGASACAKRTSNSTWYCWGYASGYVGMTGAGNLGGSGTPVAVLGAENYSSVAVGYYGACGILADGSLRCWGQSLALADHSVFRSWFTPIDVTNWLRP
ncbi:Ig-like domain-containing protein [Bdellovibrio sp. HCB185ZH]|uniref:Ig-like domain-containing protein n=1 Tax=Bdellovibrio sp. HCB185ZH TaxID=3394235 RepID=UPI0039A6ACFA